MDRPSEQDGELVRVPLRYKEEIDDERLKEELRRGLEEFRSGLEAAGSGAGPPGSWVKEQFITSRPGVKKSISDFRKITGDVTITPEYFKRLWNSNVENVIERTPMEDVEFAAIKGVVWNVRGGWTGIIWAPKFDRFVTAKVEEGDGSLIVGDIIEMTVIPYITPNGVGVWKAKNFKSNYRRVLTEPIDDSRLLELEIGNESGASDIEAAMTRELTSREVEIIECLDKGNTVRIILPENARYPLSTVDGISEIEIPAGIQVLCTPIVPKLPEMSEKAFEESIGAVKKKSYKHMRSCIYLEPHPKEALPIKQRSVELKSSATIDNISRAYQDILRRRLERKPRPWMVFGDETGNPMNEALGKATGKRRLPRMMWIIIEPRVSNLPPTHPYFHASDSEIFSDLTLDLLRGEKGTGLAAADGIHCMVFNWVEGDSLGKGGVESANLAMWNLTLPVVLNKIYRLSDYKPVDVEILIEQADIKEGERPLLAELQRQYKAHGPKWLNPQTWIVKKDPNQHPWIAYTDAVGFVFDADYISEEERVELTSDYDMLPYRERGLNEHIGPLLKLTSNPKRFLIQLFDLPLGEFNAYSESVLCESTTRALGSLGDEDWEAVIGLTNTNDPRIARIAQFICDLCSDSMYEGIVSNRIKFEFGMMKLGYSRHKGDWRESELWSDRIDELRVGYDWYWPRQDRFWGFINMKNSIGNDRFDFRPEKLEEELRWFFPERDGPYPPYARKSAGSVALTKGLRAEREGLDAEEAIRIESRIFEEEPIDNDDLIFRYTMKAELAAEFGDPSDVYELLMVEMTNRLGSIGLMDRLEENPFLCAVLLKSVVNAEFNAKYTRSFLSILCGKKEIDKGKTKRNYLKEHVERGNNPSQRVAYWFIRAALKYSRESNRAEFADEIRLCADGLIRMISDEKWRRDASGVIIACELLDLSHRGITGIDDPENFLDTVLENSHQSTKDWVAKYPPNKDDWLAPLNFNYR